MDKKEYATGEDDDQTSTTSTTMTSSSDSWSSSTTTMPTSYQTDSYLTTEMASDGAVSLKDLNVKSRWKARVQNLKFTEAKDKINGTCRVEEAPFLSLIGRSKLRSVNASRSLESALFTLSGDGQLSSVSRHGRISENSDRVDVRTLDVRWSAETDDADVTNSPIFKICAQTLMFICFVLALPQNAAANLTDNVNTIDTANETDGPLKRDTGLLDDITPMAFSRTEPSHDKNWFGLYALITLSGLALIVSGTMGSLVLWLRHIRMARRLRRMKQTCINEQRSRKLQVALSSVPAEVQLDYLCDDYEESVEDMNIIAVVENANHGKKVANGKVEKEIGVGNLGKIPKATA